MKKVDVAVIGAGLSGLVCAYELKKKGFSIMVAEASQRPGGCLSTIRKDGYLLDNGANSLLPDGDTLQWLADIGIKNEILAANPGSKARFLLKKGKYRALPDGPGSMLFGSFFSFRSKLKLLADLNIKPGIIDPNTSVDDFVRTRYGNEIADYVANPFVRGVYAGNAGELLLCSAFPAIAELARTHGSLIKGMMKTKSGNRKISVNFTNGMQSLANFLADEIKEVNYDSKIESINKSSENGFQIVAANREWTADTVVMTCGKQGLATLPAALNPAWPKEAILQINYPQLGMLHLGYDASFNQLPTGFGGLHPAIEGTMTSGIIRTSNVFKHRAPKGKFLVTAFVPIHKNAQAAKESDIIEEVNRLCGFNTPPEMIHRTEWIESIPQYDSKRLKAVEAINAAPIPGMYLCTNITGGVSVNDRITDGRNTARLIAKEIAKN